jgi:hypothetical protein
MTKTFKRTDEHCDWTMPDGSLCTDEYQEVFHDGATPLNPSHQVSLCEKHRDDFIDMVAAYEAEQEGPTNSKSPSKAGPPLPVVYSIRFSATGSNQLGEKLALNLRRAELLDLVDSKKQSRVHWQTEDASLAEVVLTAMKELYAAPGNTGRTKGMYSPWIADLDGQLA